VEVSFLPQLHSTAHQYCSACSRPAETQFRLVPTTALRSLSSAAGFSLESPAGFGSSFSSSSSSHSLFVLVLRLPSESCSCVHLSVSEDRHVGRGLTLRLTRVAVQFPWQLTRLTRFFGSSTAIDSPLESPRQHVPVQHFHEFRHF
jgi:hypothetical protein